MIFLDRSRVEVLKVGPELPHHTMIDLHSALVAATITGFDQVDLVLLLIFSLL
jgi:hypothetical protein